MATSTRDTDVSTLSCPTSGTELADRLHAGLSLEEALGERALGRGPRSADASTQQSVRTPRRSWVFAGLLAVSLLGWPVAFYQGKVVDQAEAKVIAKETLATEYEELARSEQAHAAMVEQELRSIQEQSDFLDRKQVAIIEMIGHCSEQFAVTVKELDIAVAEGRIDAVIAHFLVFCALVSEDNELFEDQIEVFLNQVRDIINGIPVTGNPNG